MTRQMPPDVVAGLAGANPAALDISSHAEYVAVYGRRAGRAGIPDMDYPLAFNLFRLAAVFQRTKGRALRGTAVNAQAIAGAAQFRRLARTAGLQAERTE